MSCSDCQRLLDLTAAGTVAAEDVGVAPDAWTAAMAHMDRCAACSADRAALLEVAEQVATALRRPAGQPGTEAFVGAVLARLDESASPEPVAARGPGRLVALLTMAAAALVVVALRLGPYGGDTVAVSRHVYPLAPGRVADYTGPRFVDVTAASSIIADDHTGRPDEKDWMMETVGHGAAVLDADGDGDLDLFVPDGNRIDAVDRVANTWRLFRNDGDLEFTDITAESGLLLDDWGACAVAGDLNGDGHTDLFVGCFGQNRLFFGRPGGRFEDVSEAAGITGRQEEWTVAAALGDVDGDGDLDLYAANYADMRVYRASHPAARACNWKDMPIACGPTNLEPQADRLYLNRGDGTFELARDRLPGVHRYSFQPMMLDFDADGDLDVFVAADAHPNQLLLNDGTGRFVDQALAAGVAADANGHEQACMGVSAGDVDGDGVLDLLATNFSHEPYVLYRGTGAALGFPTFSDVTLQAGLRDSTFLTLGWGVSLADLDCDGDLDAVTANGHLYPGVRSAAPETDYEEHISVLENRGDGRFRDVTGSTGATVIPRVHRGLVVADFDGDRRPELFATVLNGRAVLLANDGRGCGRALLLDLRRRDGNVEAAGAAVEVTLTGPTGTRTLVRHVVIGSSFACSEDPRVHVGLGREGRVTGVAVRWPGGARETFGALEGDTTYRIVENSGRAERLR